MEGDGPGFLAMGHRPVATLQVRRAVVAAGQPGSEAAREERTAELREVRAAGAAQAAWNVVEARGSRSGPGTRRERRIEDGSRRRAGKQAAAGALANALPASRAGAERHQRQLELGWESVLGEGQPEEMRRRAGLLIAAWGGQDMVCPLALYWALVRNTLVGTGCYRHCCAGRVLGRQVLPCSVRGDLDGLEAMVRDIDGVSEATALFGGALTEWGPWRRLDREPAEQGEMAPPVTGREPAEQGGEAPSVAVPADRVDAGERPRLAERERRWADRMEEDDEEAECGEGPSAPALLQGDDLAGAEGYDVTDEPASADNHLSSILDGDDDDI